MQTVFVGLSGGVDSAVSAYLLKKEGYKVVGAFIKVWEPDFLPCTSGQDRLSAMRAATHLGIPFVSYDLAEEYKKGVVDYFIEEYKAGRTPNPDVVCNREIKFGAFWEKAKANGADMIATGHYAISNQLSGSSFQLSASKDKEKDQSYFLWTLTQNDLAHVLFPIGHLHKKEVRRIAKKAGLPNAGKKDSQGLCFLGHVDMKEFLQRYIPVKKGVVRDAEGKPVGEHDGVWFYTLEQRFPLQRGEKMYVIGKNIEKNELIVANSNSTHQSGNTEYILRNINWIREVSNENELYEAHIRYHGERLFVQLRNTHVYFDKPTLVAEGQSLVVYNSTTQECMGGGIIGSNANH